MNYLESNRRKWYKAQQYNVEAYYSLRTYIKSNGAFFEYDPFKTPREIYEDFYLLMRKVEAYRAAFIDIGTASAKSGAVDMRMLDEIQSQGDLQTLITSQLQGDPQFQINQQLQDEIKISRHNYYSKLKEYENKRNEIVKQYIEFANRWGLLGCGFNRIIDISHSSSHNRHEKNIVHEQGKVKKLMLREADTSFDLDLSLTHKIKSGKYSKYKSILPDNLPVSGGAVPLSTWNKDYTGLDFRNYSESLNALVGCRELLSILYDINGTENNGFNIINGLNKMNGQISNKGLIYHPDGMELKDDKLTWSFNSLIQALSIIHILNKTGQLSKMFSYRMLQWNICRECKRMYDIKHNHQMKYCSSICRETAKKRNYRAKKKQPGRSYV